MVRIQHESRRQKPPLSPRKAPPARQKPPLEPARKVGVFYPLPQPLPLAPESYILWTKHITIECFLSHLRKSKTNSVHPEFALHQMLNVKLIISSKQKMRKRIRTAKWLITCFAPCLERQTTQRDSETFRRIWTKTTDALRSTIERALHCPSLCQNTPKREEKMQSKPSSQGFSGREERSTFPSPVKSFSLFQWTSKRYY